MQRRYRDIFHIQWVRFMNILFLTLLDFKQYSDRNIYCDLLREFIRNGHDVYCISPTERRFGLQTHLEENGRLLKLRIGNTQKTNLLEKGISTVMIEPQFKRAIKKYFSNVKFDLVLYSTPPITLLSAIKYVQRRDHAETYLMLKDIFPQNAVDLGMMNTTSIKGALYRFFRNKEKNLYAVSERIGCMSQANVEYVIKHNPEIDPSIVEICPNAIEVQDLRLGDNEKIEMREKYGIPTDKTVFVYGGNLGKPQGIPFLIDCLRAEKDNAKAFFLIVGDGTEYSKLESFINGEEQKNVKLLKRFPKEEYDKLVAACDIGMIFLDYRFTIPNFPSRLLSYMQAGLPVLACTDSNTDIGQIVMEGHFGWWLPSNDVEHVKQLIESINEEQLAELGFNGFQYLCEHYSVDKAYKIINCNMM